MFRINPSCAYSFFMVNQEAVRVQTGASAKGDFVRLSSFSKESHPQIFKFLVKTWLKREQTSIQKLELSDQKLLAGKNILIETQKTSSFAGYDPLLPPSIEAEDWVFSKGSEIPRAVQQALKGFDPRDCFSEEFLKSQVIWAKDAITKVWWPYRIGKKHPSIRTPKSVPSRQMRQTQVQDQFSKKRYARVPRLIPPAQIPFLQEYFSNLLREGFLRLGDRDSDFRSWTHNDGISRMIGIQLEDHISKVAGEAYVPFFTKTVVYLEQSKLDPHHDREEDAITLSLLVDYEVEGKKTEDHWPLIVQDGKNSEKEVSVLTGIGSGTLFDGFQLNHYRGNIPKGHRSTSILLTFVREGYEGKYL